MKQLTLKSLSFYRNSSVLRSIRQGLPFGYQVCKYVPTCSEYTFDAIKKHGVLKGAIMGSWRVLRCNPWSRGGLDPVK